MKKYYKELTLMKGIGIILVVFGHSYSFKGFNILNNNLINRYLYDTIYSFHMPLFFLISGFLSNKNKDNLSKKYYVIKIKRLLIPYIFINMIDIIPRHLFINFVNNKSNGLERVLLYSGAATWFVYTLFLLFLIFPFIEKIVLKKDNYYLFGLILLILNINNIGNNFKILTIDKLVYMSFYFYTGYILKKYYENMIDFMNSKPQFYKGLVIIFLFYGYKYNTSGLIRVLTPFLGIALTWILAIKIKDINKKYVEFIIFCGENSLVFYLLESFCGAVYRVLLIRIIPIEYNFILIISFFLLKLWTIYYVVKYIVCKWEILSILLGAKYEFQEKITSKKEISIN